MIKIEGSTSVSPRLPINKVSQQSFTGNYTKEITEGLYHKNAIKHMESLKWLKGEIGGILLTALGTGMVAPIFIGFNPFVKPRKDATPEEKQEIKDTKQYTAMRQPISAVLAILFQASVQKYIDKGLDKVFNDPEIAKYARVNLDQSILNTESRIKDNVKNDMKKQGKTKPSLIKSWFSQEAKDGRKAYNAEFDELVKAKKEEQIKKVADQFELTGKITPGSESMKNNKVAELVNQQIDQYVKDIRALVKTEEGQIPYYLERAEILTENSDELRRILQPIKDAKSVTIEQLDQLIATYKDTNPKISALIQEIKDKPEDLRMHRITRTLDRLDRLEQYLKNGKLDVDAYRQAMLDRNTVLLKRISELAGLKFKNPDTANEAKIKEIVGEIARVCDFSDLKGKPEEEILKNTDIFGEDLSKLKTKVFKDITKRYKKLVENHYKSWNQFTKIGVGVFITLPITCTALNWVYPRFMEIFFPRLSGVKKAQMAKKEQNKVGGDK